MKRKKSIAHRLAFYSRKVNEYSASRFDNIRGISVVAAPTNRHQRLLTYRAAIYRRIDEE